MNRLEAGASSILHNRRHPQSNRLRPSLRPMCSHRSTMRSQRIVCPISKGGVGMAARGRRTCLIEIARRTASAAMGFAIGGAARPSGPVGPDTASTASTAEWRLTPILIRSAARGCASRGAAGPAYRMKSAWRCSALGVQGGQSVQRMQNARSHQQGVMVECALSCITRVPTTTGASPSRNNPGA